MPSPVGHILAGTAVYLAATRQEHRSRLVLSVTLLGSILPDADFFPGLLIGEPAAFHHGISHSLAFAILYGALVLFILRFFHSTTIARQAAALGAVAYASHILLDVVNVNESTRGVPILWPLIKHQFGFNLFLFGHFHHGGFNDGIWSVVRWDNIPAVTRELAVLGPPVLLLWLWREWRSQDRSKFATRKKEEFISPQRR